jgi:hypothetical protein
MKNLNGVVPEVGAYERRSKRISKILKDDKVSGQ